MTEPDFTNLDRGEAIAPLDRRNPAEPAAPVIAPAEPLAAILRPTRCAICGSAGGEERWPAALDAGSFNRRVFSARRPPDRVHYRMVRCAACGLVRSDPAADPGTLARLYARAGFDYADEVPNLRRTYGRHLARADRHAARQRGRLLEIGCGSGFVLEEAVALGFASVRGVEPSSDAIAAADPSVRGRIVEGTMDPGLFGSGAFDLVCMFQVFDHLPDPAGMLDEIRRVLAPGGVLLLLHHDVDALPARLLGERSPIVDIEHCFLYSRRTMAALLAARRFEVIETGRAVSTVSLSHAAHLLPAPPRVRGALRAALDGRAGRLALRVALGNLFAIAGRPAR